LFKKTLGGLTASLLIAVALWPSDLPAQNPTSVDLQAVRVGCQVTDYTMEPGQVDQAVVIRDPAGEQTVLFDITEGGAIVSLKYRGLEHIWGYNGGGLLQMAFHNARKVGKLVGDYNPTQAGDGSAMSPVTGVACHGTDSVDILTMMLDFNHNNSFYQNPLIAVWGGRMNSSVPLSYFSPYTLETHSRWVWNPSGEPKYYLRLDERFTHLTDEKIGTFDYDFADYEPWEFRFRAVSPGHCPCASSSTTYMAGGWYRDEARFEGLAVAMPSSNFPGRKVNGGFNSDYIWRNRNFHLEAQEPLDGIASKSFVWYVMAGSWQNALSFARNVVGSQGDHHEN
jgi:hypothetical protein